MRRARTVTVVGGVVALVAATALAASLADGGGEGTANGNVPVAGLDDLSGRWVVINDVGAPAPTLGPVRLVVQRSALVVETGCNAARGEVAVENSVLVAGEILTTRMACEPPLMAQEQWLVEMVTSRPRLERSGPYLYLLWGDREQWWLGLEQEEGRGQGGPAGQG